MIDYDREFGATRLSPPPPFFFMTDYDREFDADQESYKNMGLKINEKCSNLELKVQKSTTNP